MGESEKKTNYSFLGWRLRMERWRERRSLWKVLIKITEELRRKKEWMKMLVRILLHLRLRIGLKGQVKVVRKYGHQGLTI